MNSLEKLSTFYHVSQSKYLGPVRFRSILKVLGENIGRIFGMTDEELLNIPGVTKQVLKGIRENSNGYPGARSFMENQIAIAKKCRGGIIMIDDPNYPQFIKNSSMCHPLLFYKGNIEKFTDYKKSLAIVGSRKASKESEKIAQDTAFKLSKTGWVIASGMALGIDSAAHRGCLKAGGLTIAILGCGPDVVYPSKMQYLYNEIADKGLLISEFPFNTIVEDWKLQKRNKTIVAASLGAFVVESSAKGGAMNAVKACKEQKKMVFTLSPKLTFLKFNDGNHNIETNFNGKVLCPKNAAKAIEDEFAA